MKKLKLQLEELSVDSFATDREAPKKGTVIAHVTYQNCTTDDGQYTIDYPLSCDGLCGTYYCTDEFSCGYTWCTNCPYTC